ncbi:MAG TPA: helix-turn-helix domain-containing protein [Streptosporangiaceae bacterium]|jgi:AcrR family transcriptional regulator
MAASTRERIIVEALRLFAERGYSATAVAEIEAAAGLSPGAGGLYRHFRSKEEVLAATVEVRSDTTRDELAATLLGDGLGNESDPLPERLRLICKAGLRKVGEEQQLLRVLFRDLDQFPQLVETVRVHLTDPVYRALADWLKRQPEFAGDIDWPSAATVLGGAIVNHWLACSQMHAPPLGIEEERFIDSWVRLALGLAAPADPADPAAVGRTVSAARG